MRPNRNSATRRGLVVPLLVFGLLAGTIPPIAAAAEPSDIILDWNQHAVAALANPGSANPPGAGQTPPVSAVHLAIVQGAVYDAVNAIHGGRAPYLPGFPSAPASASMSAAVATAAHHVLAGLPLPAPVITHLDGVYAASLAAIPDGQPKADGIAVGTAAAAAMLTNRTNDGRYSVFSFTAGTGIGVWRPVPPSGSDPFAWVAKVRPFALDVASQLRTEGPLDISSPQYAEEFAEVKALGALNGSSRTQDQTDLARFVTTNPLPMMNRALREVASARGVSLADAARLFAASSMSSADALIACWDDKAYWSFWRPTTAIRLAADDGNPATEADPAWEPMFTNPPYPDHPSGYNCFTGGMMHAARLFFGTDKVSFDLNSSSTGMVRSYDRFTDVIDDTIDGRIYTGFHFRTPDVQGAWIGKKAAQWVHRHLFGVAD